MNIVFFTVYPFQFFNNLGFNVLTDLHDLFLFDLTILICVRIIVKLFVVSFRLLQFSNIRQCIMLICRVREWRIERNYQRCKKPEAIPRVRSFEIGNGAGASYDDGLFRLACRADSLLQKPIQLSVTPRIANCRVSERPLLSPQICGSATPHRPYTLVDSGRR